MPMEGVIWDKFLDFEIWISVPKSPGLEDLQKTDFFMFRLYFWPVGGYTTPNISLLVICQYFEHEKKKKNIVPKVPSSENEKSTSDQVNKKLNQAPV